jgi:hypothetical protein
MYNNPMKKNKKPLGKANEARRLAEAKELFRIMLNAKAGVIPTQSQKETRSQAKRKAINEF